MCESFKSLNPCFRSQVRKKKKKMMKRQQQAPHYWLFDSRSNSRRSTPWLQSTLAELEKNTEAMLKLIQEDADSFAQRAEMYYKKRPQLISMIEEFYRAHRSLAERYDLVKSDSGTRLLKTLGSPFSSKCHSEKSMSVVDETYDSLSETCEHEDYTESEVDDPDPEYETQPEKVTEEKASVGVNDEVRKPREEIKRLQEENRIQKDQLKQKDDEKREVIRQLSVAVDVYKQENVNLRKHLARESADNSSPFFEFNKLKGTFLGKLLNRSPKSHAPIAL